MLLGNFQKKAKRPDGGDRRPTGRRSPATPSTRARSSAWPSPTRTRAGSTRRGSGFERARELDPRNGKVLWQLADLAMRKGEPAKAEAVIQDALASKVDEHRFLLKLGESYIEAKRYDEAEQVAAPGAREEAEAPDRPLQPGPRPRGEGPDRRRPSRPTRRSWRRTRRRTARPSTWPSCCRSAGAADGGARALPARRWRCSPTSAPASSTWPRPSSTRATSRARSSGRGRASLASPDPRIAPLGHYVLADVYNRQGRADGGRARGGGSRAACSAAAECATAVRRRRAPGARRCLRLACGARPQALAAAPPAHLVLVTIDTLRADRVGAYGNARRGHAAPRPLAREGALAPQATAHVPLTRPSHVSLFTGRLPRRPASATTSRRAVVPDGPAAGRGPEGAPASPPRAFVSSVVLSSASGLDRGFDVYSDEFEGGRRRRAVPEHGPEARRRDDRRGHRLARECAAEAPAARLPLAPPLRPPRPLRAAGALRLALRADAPTTARWPGADELVGRLTTPSRGSGCATRRCWW